MSQDPHSPSHQTPHHTSHQRKFKNFLIQPAFQSRLVGYFFGLFVFSTCTFYSTVFLFFWKFKQKALKVGIPQGHVFYRFLENLRADIDSLFIVLAVFNFILLIGVGFYISHRIAGPIYKLTLYLTSIRPDHPPFRLRKNDFFKDLQPVVDDLRGRLK